MLKNLLNMCSLTDMCFMCTNNYNCSFVNDRIVHQVEYLLPEITVIKLGVPLRICCTCEKKLQSFNEFKHSSLENSLRLEARIKKSQCNKYSSPHVSNAPITGSCDTKNEDTSGTNNIIEDISIKEEPCEETADDREYYSNIVQNIMKTEFVIINGVTCIKNNEIGPEYRTEENNVVECITKTECLTDDNVKCNEDNQIDTKYDIEDIAIPGASDQNFEEIYVKNEVMDESSMDYEDCDDKTEDKTKGNCITDNDIEDPIASKSGNTSSDQTAKREYNKWSKEDMDAATQNYNNGTQKFNEVCRVYGIPKPTFRRHLRGLNSRGKIGRPRDLTAEMEVELVCHVLDLESRLFDLTTKDLKRLASQLSEKYKLPHRFNKEKQLAGWTWYYKFIKNHPEITLRTAESTSIARCKGLKKVVTEFFDKYEKILDDLKFKPNQIFNVDGRIHKVISEERGINTTCICCMNATGEFIPPMVIFKCKSMTDDIKRGGPPNTLYTCSETGWIIAALFVEWLHHFIKHLKLKKVLDQRQQILLILDGHTTHTKNLDAINLAKEYGIIMLSLPAQLQPLDISVFKPLKHYFNEECTAWIRNNPGAVIKQTNISEILGIAYSRAVCVETAINGFELCGLWPCNRHKLRDEEKDETTTQNSVRLTEPGPSTSNVPINEYNPSVSPIRAKRRVDFQQNILKKKTRKLVLQAM